MNFVENKRGFILWIMGPTSSGKTTLGRKILKKLRNNGRLVVHYDGDEVRELFGPNLNFSKADRLMVVRTIVHLSNKALDSGVNVIVSALTAHQSARDYVRENVKNLILTYLDCGIEKCIKRDVKGLYAKARKGEIQTLIGVNGEYLPLRDPDIMIRTEETTVEVSTNELIDNLRERGVVV